MPVIRLTIDGVEYTTDPVGAESLLTTLRDRLGLTGSKNACEQGECGSCSVVLDDELVCSCLVMTADADGSVVTTVAGLASGDELHAVQSALVEEHGVQCGYCTPGFAVAAAHLFESDPSPSRDDLKEALSGNICRCTGYGAILRALTALAEESP
ncbi:MAG: (2Fe-2S)-binding protein [Acidimicrobiia bacterium]|nr:(2Fe-2S)-binding protein [Acidimicrobiia bacterium]